MHTKRVCKDIKIKELGEYHPFYYLDWLLPGVFENFRKMCLKIHHLNSVKFP